MRNGDSTGIALLLMVLLPILFEGGAAWKDQE
jgi:hypothetical protein